MVVGCLLSAKSGLMQCRKGMLFDYFISAGEQARWEREAKRLGSLEVDDLGRRLHRKIGWLLALEDAIDIAGGSAMRAELVHRDLRTGHTI